MADVGKKRAIGADRQGGALGAYVNLGNKRVPGWLDGIAIRSILALDAHQRELGVEGSMCEIGVHRARLLILLHLLSRSNELTVGFDLFELVSGDVAAAYGEFDREYLAATLREHGCEMSRIKLVACDSTKLHAEEVLRLAVNSVRIFSVDGGHDARTALSDMCLAEQVLAPGGVVLLDDIFNEQWCGVVEAAARFLLRSDQGLVPYFYAGNKMFFANGREFADKYRERMTRELGDESIKVETFFGHPVLIAQLKRRSVKAKMAAAVLGETGFRVLRESRLWLALRGGSSRPQG
jgi:hypothetical protein